MLKKIPHRFHLAIPALLLLVPLLAHAQGGGPPGGTVLALAIDPANPATLYAGTNGGVYKSADGGSSWTTVNSGVPLGTIAQALAIDPSTPATLYAGTSDGGVFKSTNTEKGVRC